VLAALTGWRHDLRAAMSADARKGVDTPASPCRWISSRWTPTSHGTPIAILIWSLSNRTTFMITFPPITMN
jgi:hypothetical protein